MNIVLVDDEKIALSDLRQAVQTACPDSRIECFADADEAIAHVKEYCTDVAFLDIRMPEMDGLELAKQIKEAQADTNIVFVTGYSQYAIDAFSIHASGYLLKPASVECVKKEIVNLRSSYPKRNGKRIFVHTFGNFEVFYDNEPLKFGRGKSKELLAYLVDRKGAGCTTAELCAVLWEDREYDISMQKQFQTIVSDLLKSLRKVGAEGIVVKRRNFLSIHTEEIDCDYYQFLRGDVSAVNAYTGEYMTNYSWAEFTTGFLHFLSHA